MKHSFLQTKSSANMLAYSRNRLSLILSTFLILLVGLLDVNAFSIVSYGNKGTTITTTTTSLYGWADAFKNDDSLGKAVNPGLKNGPNFNEQVTVNGKIVPGAVVGQKLTVVAGRVRVKIPVNCQKGDCGTCMVNLNGRKVKGKWKRLRVINKCFFSLKNLTILIYFLFSYIPMKRTQHVKQRYQAERQQFKLFKNLSP